MFAEPDERARAARYWVEWNRAAARAALRDDLVYVSYRLENLDADRAAALVAAVEGTVDRAAINAALERLPNNANTRPSSGRPQSSDVPLADLPGVAELAEQFGYELEH